ncbi:MAG: proteasome assembly chaperone family protein [Stackebrandtia sp.]
MSNARDLFEVETGAPDVNGVVLLVELRGFMDAGQAGQGVTEYLLRELDHQVVATFDVDELIDYRGRRPSMTFDTDRWVGYDAPQLKVHLLRDDAGAPFLLLSGDEPDVRWERFADAVQSLVEYFGVRLTVAMRGIPMGAPHTRPLGVTAHGTDKALLPSGDRTLNRLQVPGNVTALLELRLGEAGHDAMGFAVHVPHYLSQASYPNASVRLLDSLRESTGLSVSLEPLREAGRAVDAEVDSQVGASSEVSDVVSALERQYDMFEDSRHPNLLSDDADDLPTGDELGEQFERFLAEQQRRGE